MLSISWYKKLLLHIWLSRSIFAYFSISFSCYSSFFFFFIWPSLLSLPFAGLRLAGAAMAAGAGRETSIGAWPVELSTSLRKKKIRLALHINANRTRPLPTAPEFAFLWQQLQLQLMECCSSCCLCRLFFPSALSIHVISMSERVKRCSWSA